MDSHFHKEHRLLKKQDFEGLRQGSSASNFGALRVIFKSRESTQEYSRIGISVSRKVGKAYLRNKIKRILRENFRNSPLKFKGLDLLIILNPRRSKLLQEKGLEQFMSHVFEQSNSAFNKLA